MLVTEQERLKEDLQALAQRHGRGRGALLPILQDVQTRHGQVSGYAMQVIADLLDIHPVEVFSVVSFYAFLNAAPQGRFVVRLCRTITCDMAGKDRVARQLENDLKIKFGETTPDGRFTLEWANCLGMCDQGPALLVNDQVLTKVTPEQVHEILEACRKSFSPHALAAKEEHHS
jgi:[NiFe] hydrogenase diaphorase moiety large subunit